MPVLLQNYKRIFENDEEVFAIYNRGLRVWPVGDLGPETPDYTEPLYFENITDETETIKFTHYHTGPDILVQYSFNKTGWVNWGIAGAGHSISLQLPPKFKVWIRSKNDGFAYLGTTGYHRFSGMSKVGGNIMSIFYGEDFTGTETVLPQESGGVKGSLFSLFGVPYDQTSTLIDAGSLLLPATTLVTDCYWNMFANCTTLLSGPKLLPATTLTYRCYEGMFVNCQNLMNTPKLPALTLAQECYQQMFQNCYKITSINCQAKDISATDCTLGWTAGVPSSICCNMTPVETFYKNPNMNSWTTGMNGIPDGWKVVHDYKKEYFYVENITNSTETVTFQKEGSGSTPSVSVQYSSDTETWTTLGTISTTALTLQLNAGQKLYLRANTTAWGGSSSARQTIKGCSKIGGNIMSLLYGSNFTGAETSIPSNTAYAFKYLFRANTELQDSSKLVLPATSLPDRCYAGIFLGCTSLVSGPEVLPLPVSTDVGCYAEMFNGCTNVENVPNLPLSVLPERCYDRLFNGCSKVDTITCLATDMSAPICLNNWTAGVAANGTFYKKAGVTWPTGSSGIPTGWTVVEV